MDLLKKVLLIVLMTTACSAGTVFIVDEEQPPAVDLDVLFAPGRQAEFISPEGLITFGPEGRYTYSVFEEYSFLERCRMWQECQKWLVYDDQETLLYMYQFVVKPYPFPLNEYVLAVARPVPVPVPCGSLLALAGVSLVMGAIRRRRFG